MIRQTKDGIWVIDGDSHHTVWIERSGKLAHDEATLPKLSQYIPKGGIVVDGGAHVGSHTGFYLDCVGPEGKVIAFEPGQDAYRCLVNNCPDATTYQLALGRRYGLSRIVHDNNYGGAHLSNGEDGSGHAVITVPLDEFALPNLSFLKLDVEGYEIEALNGASDTIWRCSPIILVEVNEGALKRQGVSPAFLYDLIPKLGKHRYRYEYLFPEHHMNMPQTDVICFPLST